MLTACCVIGRLLWFGRARGCAAIILHAGFEFVIRGQRERGDGEAVHFGMGDAGVGDGALEGVGKEGEGAAAGSPALVGDFGAAGDGDAAVIRHQRASR